MKDIEITVLPSELNDASILRSKCEQKLPKGHPIKNYKIIRRSIDARGSQPVYRLKVQINYPQTPSISFISNLPNVSQQKSVIIVGAGPAGYFAALELIENGLKPIIVERGKDVQSRRRDLKAIQQLGIVNPHSNYCFGEGGAGTYSDGKLYTRSHKRGKINKSLKIFVEHGANSDILIDAHPHIGSNKLPKIVANIRETILEKGGVILFDSHVTDFVKEKDDFKGIEINKDKCLYADATILATGHSARDIFYLCKKHKIKMEQKPFALGVRIEHDQSLVDNIQYNQKVREKNLPASSYSLVCQIENRGVFSFCMCPGGLVVPAATAPGEIVVNGMSLSKRNSPFANSGTVVAIENEDLFQYKEYDEFAGLIFQQEIEQKIFKNGDGSQKAPAQRLTDFVNGKVSNSLNDSSYIPGLYTAPIHELLPKFVSNKLQEAVKVFGNKMKGYYTASANVIATESRTSSPIKIPRDKETLMHIQVKGLFPCGEGAGYAGGILSACMDGQNVAKAVVENFKING